MNAGLLDKVGPRRQVGRLYKLLDNGYAVDVLACPAVDRAAMSATATIATMAVDRVREVVVPRGIRVAQYAKNPIVLWEHGFQESIPFPIAKCERPDGSLAIAMRGENMEGTSYFTTRSQLSEQIFGLIDDGIVRAVSVQVIPDRHSMTRTAGEDGPVVNVNGCELVEWSWGCIGVNPEALRKTLSRNRVAGRQLAEPLYKSLLPYAEKPKRYGVGFRSTKKMIDVTNMTDDELNAARSSASPEDQAAIDSELANRGGGGSAGAGGDLGGTGVGGDVEAAEPLGATVTSSTYTALQGLISQIETAVAPCENDDVKNALGSLVEQLRGHLTELEGLYSSQYPDAEPLATESTEPDEAMMKSFLSLNAGSCFRLVGAARQMDVLAKSASIGKQDRGRLSSFARMFDAMVKSARLHRDSQISLQEQFDKRLKEEKEKSAAMILELGSQVSQLTELVRGAIKR